LLLRDQMLLHGAWGHLFVDAGKAGEAGEVGGFC
jgi:hypothetical protein